MPFLVVFVELVCAIVFATLTAFSFSSTNEDLLSILLSILSVAWWRFVWPFQSVATVSVGSTQSECLLRCRCRTHGPPEDPPEHFLLPECLRR